MPRQNRRGKKLSDLPARQRKMARAIAEGAPELLEDVDFALERAVRAPRAAPKKREGPIQMAVVNGLRKRLPRGSLVWFTPNAARSQNHRYMLVREGMVPGWPDLGVLCPLPGRAEFGAGYFLAFIEMKAPKGVVSEQQDEVQDMIRALGVPVLRECRSLEEAVSFLRKHGVEVRD